MKLIQLGGKIRFVPEAARKKRGNDLFRGWADSADLFGWESVA